MHPLEVGVASEKLHEQNVDLNLELDSLMNPPSLVIVRLFTVIQPYSLKRGMSISLIEKTEVTF